jgi:RHS repeat-associated protein
LVGGHTDHLNTPRQVYDDQQQLRWKWDQAEPFGVTTPDENPLNLGAFELPIRFPGQYSDKETNLSYNYFRDYDSNVGRYVQADPIGLHGGNSVFLYVRSPLTEVDPQGLMGYGPSGNTRSAPGPVGFGGSAAKSPYLVCSIKCLLKREFCQPSHTGCHMICDHRFGLPHPQIKRCFDACDKHNEQCDKEKSDCLAQCDKPCKS